MNIVEHVSLLHAGESSGYMPRSGIAGSFGSDMPSFLRDHQTDFQSGCTNLQPHQQWRSVPLSPHPCQHLLSPEFLILAILTSVKYNLRIVLICLSIMTTTTLEISLVVPQKTGLVSFRGTCYTTPGHIPRGFPSM